MIIPEELASWIEQNAAEGMTFSQIVLRLATSFGYSIPVAKKMTSLTLYRTDGGTGALYEPSPDVPEIRTGSGRTAIALDGSNASLSYEQYFPRIVVVDDVLTPLECDSLCEAGRSLLAPAEVIERGALSEQVQARSSFTARFSGSPTPLLEQIERKIAELVKWPRTHSEHLQIQRYLPGQQYIPHFDFFEPTVEPSAFVRAGGQRLATLIIYLRQPESGGATYFSNLGLRITPRKGRALFFTYPGAAVNNGTMHSGESVQEGEKWILTKWFRQHSTVPATDQASRCIPAIAD